MRAWFKLRRFGAVNAGKLFAVQQVIFKLFGIAFSLLLLPFSLAAPGGALSLVLFIPSSLLGLVFSAVTGFISGAFFAAFFNFVASLSFVDGYHVLVDAPAAFYSLKPGEHWVKLRRVGCFNLARFQAVHMLALGVLAAPIVSLAILFLGSSSHLTSWASGYFDLVGGVVPVALLALLVIPLAAALLGFLSGAGFAFLANLALAASFVDGVDVKVRLPAFGSRPPEGRFWLSSVRLGAVNLAKFYGVMMGLLGLLAGLLVAWVFLVPTKGLSLLAIPLVAVAVGFVAFVFGGVYAAVFNFSANLKFVNGLDALVQAPPAKRAQPT